MRAGNRRGSFFAAATGDPTPDGPWPEPVPGHALELPEPEPVPAWTEPSDFDTPLIGEREGLKLLESLGRELAAELPGGPPAPGRAGGRLQRGRAGQQPRPAGAHPAAASPPSTSRPPVPGGPAADGARSTWRPGSPGASIPRPWPAAWRTAWRSSAAGAPPERDTGEFLLAPAVAARLLAGLLPLLVGPGPGARLIGARGRFGSERVTLIDNGRLAGGAFEAPVDGEGVPTREVVLVEEGLFRQPLLAWWQEGAAHGEPSGCTRRPGWRDLPTPGPTHLYLKPEPRTPVAAPPRRRRARATT